MWMGKCSVTLARNVHKGHMILLILCSFRSGNFHPWGHLHAFDIKSKQIGSSVKDGKTVEDYEGMFLILCRAFCHCLTSQNYNTCSKIRRYRHQSMFFWLLNQIQFIQSVSSEEHTII